MSKGFSKNTVLAAISNSYGITTNVADKLGVAWNTADKYIKKWKDTLAAFKAEREKILDVAEAKIFLSVSKNDLDSAKWVLARLGKDRGYVVKTEQELSGTVAQPTTFSDFLQIMEREDERRGVSGGKKSNTRIKK